MYLFVCLSRWTYKALCVFFYLVGESYIKRENLKKGSFSFNACPPTHKSAATLRSHNSPSCVKSLWPNQNVPVVASLLPLLLPSSSPSVSFLISFPLSYTLFHHCLSLSEEPFSDVFISQPSFSCSLLQPCTLTYRLQYCSVFFLFFFNSLSLIHSGPFAAFSGRYREEAVWVVKEKKTFRELKQLKKKEREFVCLRIKCCLII